MVQKVFGICEAKNGTETSELLQTRTDGLPAKEAKNWRIEEKKERITRMECQRLVNKF